MLIAITLIISNNIFRLMLVATNALHVKYEREAQNQENFTNSLFVITFSSPHTLSPTPPRNNFVCN